MSTATYTVHLADGTTEYPPVADGLGALQDQLARRPARIHATGPAGCHCTDPDPDSDALWAAAVGLHLPADGVAAGAVSS